MNILLPYEEQIAGKLVQVPLPEMEDAIWSRIEGMLDADSELDESNSKQNTNTESKTNSSFLSERVKVVLFIVVAAFILCIIIIRKQRSEKPDAKPSIPIPAHSEKGERTLVDTILNNNPQKFNKKSPLSIPDDKNQLLDSVHQTVPVFDSSSRNQSPPDSTALKPIFLSPVKKDSLTKKPKGVSGISDSDYRFRLEKKDSLKRN